MEYTNSELRPFLDHAGRLTALPAKHKKKLLVLWYIAGKVAPNRQYTEPEINDLLDEWTTFHDHATLRRELYNKHLLDRTVDGKHYWRDAELPKLEDFLTKYL